MYLSLFLSPLSLSRVSYMRKLKANFVLKQLRMSMVLATVNEILNVGPPEEYERQILSDKMK